MITSTRKEIQYPSLIRWWLRVSCPTHSDQPRWREELASLMMPIVFILTIIPLPTAVGNPPQLITLISVIIANIIVFILKKTGRFNMAGSIAVISIEVGLAMATITWPNFSTHQLPLLDLLVQTGFVVIAFFTPSLILIVGILNTLFIIIAPHVLPNMSPEMHQLPVSTIMPMVLLQLFITLICWALMTTLIGAIRRADNAEELAQLQQQANEQQKRELELAKQTEEGIQQILGTLGHISESGDFSIRVPLSQENILWRVGRSINNLLARLQGSRQQLSELERTRQVANYLSECLRSGKAPQINQWTGTCLDPILMQMQNMQKNQDGMPEMRKRSLK